MSMWRVQNAEAAFKMFVRLMVFRYMASMPGGMQLGQMRERHADLLEGLIVIKYQVTEHTDTSSYCSTHTRSRSYDETLHRMKLNAERTDPCTLLQRAIHKAFAV